MICLSAAIGSWAAQLGQPASAESHETRASTVRAARAPVGHGETSSFYVVARPTLTTASREVQIELEIGNRETHGVVAATGIRVENDQGVEIQRPRALPTETIGANEEHTLDVHLTDLPEGYLQVRVSASNQTATDAGRLSDETSLFLHVYRGEVTVLEFSDWMHSSNALAARSVR